MKSNVARRTPNRPLPRPLVHSYFSSGNAAESFCFPLPRVSRSVLDRQMSSCAADAPTTRREAFTQNSNRPLTVAELNILRKKKRKKKEPSAQTSNANLAGTRESATSNVHNPVPLSSSLVASNLFLHAAEYCFAC